MSTTAKNEIQIALTPLLIDADGVAVLLGVSRRTVYSMQSTGELGPMALTVGGRKLWRTSELGEWVAAGCPRREVWLDLQQNAN
jgi:predicted DNA-binding transcriptional regulator AlpA